MAHGRMASAAAQAGRLARHHTLGLEPQTVLRIMLSGYCASIWSLFGIGPGLVAMSSEIERQVWNGVDVEEKPLRVIANEQDFSRLPRR